VMLWIPK